MESLKSIPFCSQENFSYTRNEEDNKMIFIPKKHAELKLLEINDTARFVLNKCNGKYDIDCIINKLVEEYSICKTKDIEKDVLNILLNFWRIGIVEFVNENPFYQLYKKDLDNGYSVEILSEDDVIEIFSSSKHIKSDPRISTRLYESEASLRYRILSLSEVFFKLRGQNQKELFVGLSLDISRPKCSCSLNIYENNFDDELDYQNLLESIRWITQNYLKDFKHGIRRVDIYLETSRDLEYKEVIENLKFYNAGILNNYVQKDGEFKDIKVFSVDLNN